MSTLTILVAILALFAVILIPLMMMKSQQEVKLDQPGGHANQRKKLKKKKRG